MLERVDIVIHRLEDVVDIGEHIAGGQVELIGLLGVITGGIDDTDHVDVGLVIEHLNDIIGTSTAGKKQLDLLHFLLPTAHV